MKKEQWTEFRNELLKLHKILLEFEKNRYEGRHGKVHSAQILLGLVMDSPSFAWLRQISELIVGIDEMLESKEPVDSQKFRDTLSYCKKLLQAKAEGTSFEKNYHAAIYHDPSVALAHAKTQEALQKISH